MAEPVRWMASAEQREAVAWAPPARNLELGAKTPWKRVRLDPWRRHQSGEFADQLEGSEEEVGGAVGGGPLCSGELAVLAPGEPLE